MKSKLKKDIYDEYTKGFWEAAEEAAREVATWPAWKRLEGHRMTQNKRLRIPIEKVCAGDRFFFDSDDLKGTFVMEKIEVLCADYDNPYEISHQGAECYFKREQDGQAAMWPAWIESCWVCILPDAVSGLSTRPTPGNVLNAQR